MATRDATRNVTIALAALLGACRVPPGRVPPRANAVTFHVTGGFDQVSQDYEVILAVARGAEPGEETRVRVPISAQTSSGAVCEILAAALRAKGGLPARVGETEHPRFDTAAGAASSEDLFLPEGCLVREVIVRPRSAFGAGAARAEAALEAYPYEHVRGW